MAGVRGKAPRKKPAGRYHHGDLRRALIDQAVRTIERSGAEALTLRAVGDALGVSRTALYRHFSGKDALMAAVAQEGFRMLREALVAAWEERGAGPEGFEAMGDAYVAFAVAHPSHYRVMFGHYFEKDEGDSELREQAAAAFHALVDALVAMQREGTVRADDPLTLARFVWATTHGIAMLVLDGRLPDDPAGRTLTTFTAGRLRAALAPDSNGRNGTTQPPSRRADRSRDR